MANGRIWVLLYSSGGFTSASSLSLNHTTKAGVTARDSLFLSSSCSFRSSKAFVVLPKDTSPNRAGTMWWSEWVVMYSVSCKFGSKWQIIGGCAVLHNYVGKWFDKQIAPWSNETKLWWCFICDLDAWKLEQTQLSIYLQNKRIQSSFETPNWFL